MFFVQTFWSGESGVLWPSLQQFSKCYVESVKIKIDALKLLLLCPEPFNSLQCHDIVILLIVMLVLISSLSKLNRKAINWRQIRLTMILNDSCIDIKDNFLSVNWLRQQNSMTAFFYFFSCNYPLKIPWELKILSFHPGHPKWNQN